MLWYASGLRLSAHLRQVRAGWRVGRRAEPRRRCRLRTTSAAADGTRCARDYRADYSGTPGPTKELGSDGAHHLDRAQLTSNLNAACTWRWATRRYAHVFPMDARCSIEPLTIFGRPSPRPRMPSGGQAQKDQQSTLRNTRRGDGPYRGGLPPWERVVNGFKPGCGRHRLALLHELATTAHQVGDKVGLGSHGHAAEAALSSATHMTALLHAASI